MRFVVLAGVVVAALLLVFLLSVVALEVRGEAAHKSADAGLAGPAFFTHTASVDFCEANYAALPFVVEFQNTVSSFVIVGVALYAWATLPPSFGPVCQALAVTGLGSAAFHGTMWRSGQATDEVGMMAVVLLLIWHAHHGRHSRTLAVLFFLSVLVYTITPNPALFQLMFIGCLVYVIALTARAYEKSGPEAQAHVLRAFGCFALGATLWLMEVPLCNATPLSLHAVWHVLSSLGCYYWLRKAAVGEDPVLT